MCRHRKMSDPGHSIRSGRLPVTVLEWKNVGPRGIELEVANSQLLRCLYFPASLGRFCMTHSFSFWLHSLSSQKICIRFMVPFWYLFPQPLLMYRLVSL